MRTSAQGLFRCSNCELVYLDPVRSDLKNFYGEEYYQKCTDTPDSHGYINYGCDSANLSATFRAYLKMINKLQPQGNVLDIGCAFGDFLHVCEEYGTYRTYGVEISDFSAARAKERTHAEIHIGDLESFTPQQKMDVITMWDVLEHLLTPAAVLRRCGEILKDNGILLICTPNIESMMFKLFQTRWIHFKPCEHVNFFTHTCLVGHMKSLGFELIEKKLHWKHISLSHLRRRISQYLPILKGLIPDRPNSCLRCTSFDESIFIFKKNLPDRAKFSGASS